MKQLRIDAGLDQVDLAARIGSHQSFVSRYERGERRLDLIEVQAICTACGTNLSSFARRFEESATLGTG
ncbi:helix-turn-helix transcriptional regulator [Algiphilus sp. NNCM1]|nr:helix-turn-helix transcriptional regulator [Algiphilus acroporae]